MRRNNYWLLMASVTVLCGTLWSASSGKPSDTSAAKDAAFWCPATGVSYGVSLKHAAEHIVHVDAVAHQPVAAFQLPVWNALYQVRDFAVNVNHVKVYEGVPEWLCDRCATGDGRAEKIDKTTWSLFTSGDFPCVTFSYDITTNDPGPFGSSLDLQHGYFNWAEVLVYRPDDRNAPVSLRIVDTPMGWSMRDGGIFGARSVEEVANSSATAPSYDRLVDSPALLGKLYESTFQQDGATYHVVVDSAEADMQTLRPMLQKITAAGVEWMQDRPYEEYTFLFLAANGISGGGMEHAYSSVIDVGPQRTSQDVMNASEVSAHEFFHLWNVKRIRPKSLEPIDYAHEQYSRVLWFSEGVTQTVADILAMRAGLTDDKHLLAHLAAVTGGVQARSARLTQSAEESSVDTWFDLYPDYHRPERSVSYYAKGEILGFLIDIEMRRLTHGRRCLRDLFQYMNQQYAKQGTYFDDSEGIRLALEALTGDDFRDFFSRYISGTDELPYDQSFAYLGLRLARHQKEQVYAGLITSRTAGKPARILRVDENSAASRLHLAPGDVILEVDGKAVSGDFNQILQKYDPEASLRLKVSSGVGEIRKVKLPLSTRKIDEYQFEDLPGVTAQTRSRRTAFLRGEAEAEAQ